MRIRPIFLIAAAGLLGGIVGAHFYGIKKPPPPPVFSPAPNPYARGIYANGIIESYQKDGENINMYPEVGGTVEKILVSDGQTVKAGQPLVRLDDSIERATVAQQKSQAEAALSLLHELKAQPRKQVLAVSVAQVRAARASLKNVHDQLRKLMASYRLDPRSVSRNDLDNAKNAVNVARKNLDVAIKQYDLTRAGAWVYDIRNQERQYKALTEQYQASLALLSKYVLRAPTNGQVLSIQTSIGSYVSPQGVYGTYTQGLKPILVMGGSPKYLQVRTYVDEILVDRLPPPDRITARMFVRGTRIDIPLQYVRTQPYVTPKIQLSDQRQERVDVRVLPLIFKFARPPNVNLFPGQLVDVYVGEKQHLRLGGVAPRPSATPPARKKPK